ncbi:mandelate racemase/muconate lactonizing enzyme family protein [Azoarcus indigens]|uniref:L-alanine-DL-glutamate epimerase-like enolase superfamily enzyme n=1 Tax=Azoarcus indigens TaxID=29545 RepID=A0A4R6E1W4_9RHOO|nr:mandelate racemase/muconate lactonizing enzyme family protein [Azoarcus indigens]NMG67453.1 mandelate racemase/muconate lactonizing enzyme family protein [Azoarcus indigens]TDN50778.1 L-alanine-DL-glutamate epimerase-like enolase superfamily enzyme [Azoarcus indigens]
MQIDKEATKNVDQQHGAAAAAGARLERELTIRSVRAIPINVPVDAVVGAVRKPTALSCVLVRVETESGLVGCGFTAITEEEVVAAAINEVAAHHLLGESALNIERLWNRLYWLLTPRGQSGYGAHAIAALDIALWDLKAQALGLPLWKLLGGARKRVPVYATFGFGFLDTEQLAEAARSWVGLGFSRLKMTVGNHALQRRDEPRPLSAVIREDEARIRAVREAVGPGPELCIDANCSLDPYHARLLAQRVEDCGIAFFEEPVSHNDVRALADLRRSINIPLAAGQNEGLDSRFADLFQARAVDIAQPNVAITGGYTQCLRIAGMAQAWQVAIANGGAWPFHNMHLHAGLAHGGFIEYHHVAVTMSEQLFTGLPVPENGWLPLPEAPGLGFTPDWDAVAELARRPTSRGAGKA